MWRTDRARRSRLGGVAWAVTATLTVCTALLVGVRAEAQETVDIGLTVVDDLGFEWDMWPSGAIGDGTDDAYDGGHQLHIDGESFPTFPTATVELDGAQFVIGPATFGDIEVVRKVFISRDGAFARWIEILTNTSQIDQTVTVEIYTNLGSDDYEEFTETSTGDAAFTAEDTWVVTDDTPLGGTGDDPTVVHVLAGPGGRLPVARVYGGLEWGEIGYEYDVSVPALGQAAVMHYGVQRWYGDDGVAIAMDLSNMTTAQGLVGITDDEAALILNFVVTTDPFITVVEPREGTTLGAGAADPTIRGDLRVYLANRPAATHWRWRLVETDGAFPSSGDAGGSEAASVDSDTFVVPETDSSYAIEVAVVNGDGTMYEPLTTDTVTFSVSAPSGLAAAPTSLSFGEVSVLTGDAQELTLEVTSGLVAGILDVTSDTPEFSVTDYPDRVVWEDSQPLFVQFQPTSDAAVSGSIIVTHDGLDSPLTIPVSGSGTSVVDFTARVFDSLEFEWDIMGNGGISDGTNDAYDGGHQISIDEEAFPWFSAGIADGREVTVGPATLGAVEVTRQVYVPTDGAYARFIDLIENTTDATVSITMGMRTNLGSNGSTTVIASSSGDATVGPDDDWFVTDDSSDGFGGGDPVVAHVISGPGGDIGAISASVGDPSTDSVAYDYVLTLAPSEQVTMLQFAVQRYGPDDAIAAAESLVALLDGATEGMTDDEIASLRNFDPNAAVMEPVQATVHLGSGWNLFSLPGPSPQGTPEALLEYEVDTINAWDAVSQQFEAVDVAPLEHVGTGYFIHRGSTLDGVDATLEVNVDAPEAASVDLTIEAGWNLVGVADGGLTPGHLTSTPNTVFGWDGAKYTVASQLWPYQGYWVYNPGTAYDVTLTQLRYRLEGPAAPAIREPAAPDWEASLVVSGPAGEAATVIIGAGPAARAGYDAMDIPSPPMPGLSSRPSLHALEDGAVGRLSRSIAPTEAGHAEWPLRASLPSAATLTWDGVDLRQGESLRLYLDGRPHDLTRAGSVDVPPGARDMAVRFARVSPANTRLLANYPNPFNPETWIPFELQEASEVLVRIYGVDGGLVRALDLGYRAAGYYTARADAAYWDGRNRTGERVASGVYLYELQAGSERALRRMLVLK